MHGSLEIPKLENTAAWKRSEYIDQTQPTATIQKSFFLDFLLLVFFYLLQLITMNQIVTSTLCEFLPHRFYVPRSATERVTVAISACLAGEKVRYDGADKCTPLYPVLSAELNLIAVCPEQGAGLGVPRPPVQLIEYDGHIRAQGRENRALDVTAALHDFAEQSLPQLLNAHQLCGYLWKSRSPSCGFNSTPIFSSAGIEIDRGSGIQAAYFQRHLPYLSYCEETALSSENAALSFILRCRLVFDVLHAADASLLELHRHYAFLHENFDEHSAATLQILSTANDRKEFLAALLRGCRQLTDEVLLRLFKE